MEKNNISLFPLKNAYGLPLYAFFIYLYINIKIMECLKNIIGITRSYCNCPNIDKYRESESGYYFDESAYSYDMKQWEDVIGCQDLAETLYGFIENANRKLKRELSISLNKDRNFNRNPIVQHIGKETNKDIKLKEGDEIVIRVKSKSRGAGAYLNIKDIVASDKIEFEDIEKIDNNKANFIDIKGVVKEDVIIKDSTNGCSSCNARKNNGITVTGYLNGVAKSRSLFGITFNAEINCSYENIICNALENVDVKEVIGIIVQKIAVREGLKYLMRSNNFNRYTVMNTQVREEDVHALKAEYMRDIREWLIPMLGLDSSFCFGCSTKKRKITKSWF